MMEHKRVCLDVPTIISRAQQHISSSVRLVCTQCSSAVVSIVVVGNDEGHWSLSGWATDAKALLFLAHWEITVAGESFWSSLPCAPVPAHCYVKVNCWQGQILQNKISWLFATTGRLPSPKGEDNWKEVMQRIEKCEEQNSNQWKCIQYTQYIQDTFWLLILLLFCPIPHPKW